MSPPQAKAAKKAKEAKQVKIVQVQVNQAKKQLKEYVNAVPVGKKILMLLVKQIQKFCGVFVCCEMCATVQVSRFEPWLPCMVFGERWCAFFYL